MTDNQLEALGLLTTAGQLQARAVRMAFQALPDNDDSCWTDDQALDRAAALATIAAAGARIAHGLIAIEHVELLREFEERVDARAEGFMAAARTMADDDGRPPYDPPTMAGPYASGKESHFRADPYDPDREHGR